MTKPKQSQFESIYHPGDPAQTIDNVSDVIALTERVVLARDTVIDEREAWGAFLLLETARDALKRLQGDIPRQSGLHAVGEKP